MRQGRQRPGEDQREHETGGRVAVGIVELDHFILETQQRPRVDFQRKVQVNGATTSLLGVQVHLPQLAQRVRLHKVALVVHVKTMVDRVALQVGHETGNIDDGHKDPSREPQ